MVLTYNKPAGRIVMKPHFLDLFTEAYEQSFSGDYDLHLLASCMTLALESLICYDNYSCQMIMKSNHIGHSKWARHKHVSLQPKHKVYVLHCGIYLRACDTVLVRDISSCHDDHLC